MTAIRKKMFLSAAVTAMTFAFTAVTYGQQSGPEQDALAAAAAKQAEAKITKARLSGVYKPDLDAFLINRDSQVQPYYRTLFVDGERNAVLNLDRLGLIELERHNLKDAAWLFDRATDRINAIYAGDPEAEKAKSVWYKESVKDFKGEPYERAMTFYYRGLIKLMEGDYENARANFKSAEMQTLVSEAEHYSVSSFSALSYLSGWSSHCAGDDILAKEYYDTALKSNPKLVVPAPDDNLLIIGETNTGPTKTQIGEYKEQLKIVASKHDSTNLVFAIKGTKGDLQDARGKSIGKSGNYGLTPFVASNISEQAMMRDGRPADVILNGKAVTKDITKNVGTAAAGIGAIMAGVSKDSTTQNVGLGLAAAGLLATIIASQMTPDADIRYWDTLPDGLNIFTAHRVSGKFSVLWRVNDTVTPHTSDLTQMSVSAKGKCAIAWARQKSALLSPENAPNSISTKKPDKDRRSRDAAFRAMLLTDFTPQTSAEIQSVPTEAIFVANTPRMGQKASSENSKVTKQSRTKPVKK